MRIAERSWRAATFGSVVFGRAFGILAARVREARIDANSIQPVAQLIRWTVFVVLADRLVRRQHWKNIRLIGELRYEK